MSIKSIVAPIRGDGKGEWVLGLALAIGGKFHSHIDVLHVHAKPGDMIPHGVPLTTAFKSTILEAAGGLARREEERLVRLFDEYCKAHDLDVVPADAEDFPADRLSISWHEVEGKQADIIRDEVRFCDLIVVPQPDRAAALGMNTLQAALFDVRKLTAIAPHREIKETGRHVAIAWNGGPEAARAVNWSLPILAAAEKVSVLVANDKDGGITRSKAIRRYLRLHGIASGVQTFERGGPEVGASILDRVAEIGGDMIVMGAFGARKRSNLVLGGVTQYVLEKADIPLLMAH
ncbi:MAG: universal stress protein [Alphaproteobacteria bacterium]|nr:universal stress protein [Alphaproteobacteria bacterium]MCK5621950.1 universal stress protein [Alphaproteobacteria bacterium]